MTEMEPDDAQPAEDGEPVVADGEFAGKKKKVKKEKKDKHRHRREEHSDDDADKKDKDVGFVRGFVYAYTKLLDRLHELVAAQQGGFDARGKKQYIVKPPQVVRVGSKKVGFTNFGEICKQMNRSPDHVFQYFLAEFGTNGSITGDQQMILKGRYTAKHIENLLRKYVKEYVICSMCKSAETACERDPSTRLFGLSCMNCGASRTVNLIKTGYHATTKADRRALKEAGGK